ncbi:esterase/lipase family protein [Corynebacterium sp. NPDC060344]|uniref:esterase/lipase family protein n=1 Tax=Corynebacterium sp. NPDC060344 TaxID=3347101 RepID=UPI0036590A3E
MKPLLLKFPPTGFIPAGVLDVGGPPDHPAPDHPTPPPAPPVVCLHGTVANGGNWGALAEGLLGGGRVVVTPTYGDRGTAPLAANLAEVTGIVRATLRATGADRVDLVGHSQGGLLAGLMVAGMLRGRPVLGDGPVLDDASVRRVICLSGSHRGVRGPRGVPMPLVRATFGPALADQMRLRDELLAGDGGVPEVVRAAREFPDAALPQWFDLITDADRIVPGDCALTPDEYPGATVIRLEERLGRGVPHHRQPHDRGVAALIAELLG